MECFFLRRKTHPKHPHWKRQAKLKESGTLHNSHLRLALAEILTVNQGGLLEGSPRLTDWQETTTGVKCKHNTPYQMWGQFCIQYNNSHRGKVCNSLVLNLCLCFFILVVWRVLEEKGVRIQVGIIFTRTSPIIRILIDLEVYSFVLSLLHYWSTVMKSLGQIFNFHIIYYLGLQPEASFVLQEKNICRSWLSPRL